MIITYFKRLFRYWAVKNAKKHADRMAVEMNTSFYVIQLFGKIKTLQRWQIDHLINKEVLHEKLRDALELEKACIHIARPPKNNLIIQQKK